MRYLLVLLLTPFIANAGVVVGQSSGHTVSFTNDQSNFHWTPTAVIVTRQLTNSTTLSILRHGNGSVVKLGEITAAAKTISWIPPATFFFSKDSSLVVSSSVPSISVQMHRGPASD